MAISVQSTPGPRVSQQNPLGVLYVLGNETTDGSVRIKIGGTDLWKVEFRKDGVWEITDPPGFNRIVTNNNGDTLADNNGDVIYDNA